MGRRSAPAASGAPTEVPDAELTAASVPEGGSGSGDEAGEVAGEVSGEGSEPPTGHAATRVAARAARKARRRRVLRWLLLAVVAGLFLWWLGWLSPFTRVKHVVVSAPEGISAKVVRQASGIAATDHVPAVNADRVRANVLAELPAVADLEVRRSLPATIRLTVIPRQPFAALPSDGAFVLVDSGGIEFDTVAKAGDLPVLRASSDEGREAALAVLRSLPESLRADVRKVKASTAHDVDLTLAGGATVRWGSADQAELKAQVLSGLRAVKAAHYDVSAPMMPTTS